MFNKMVRELLETNPECHLKYDLSLIKNNTYCLIISLVSQDGEVIASTELVRGGFLIYLHEQAVEHLAREVQKSVVMVEKFT